MAQIDKLLAHITPRGGVGLSLEPDQPPMLQMADGRRAALLANPVPGTMIEMLAKELVPTRLEESWTARGEASFDHEAGDETFRLVLGRGPLGAIGHLGYTGCSLWIDRDLGLSCALLTNHVHPAGPDRPRLHAFRARFHDAVAEGLGIE